MSFAARVRGTRWPVSLFLTVGLAAGFCTVLSPPAAAADDYSIAAAFVADINLARAQAGLPAYAVAADLVSIAAGHSAQMAASQTLYHNPQLTSVVPDWQSVGENVGVGPAVSAINTAFLESPDHRANILDVHFTQVGVGVVIDSRGAIWVTEDFREPMVAAPLPVVTPPARVNVPAPVVSRPPVAVTAARSPAAPSATSRPSVVRRPTSSAAPSQARPERRLTKPTGQLAERVTWLQTHHQPGAIAANPVAQAFAYLDALSTLSGLTTG